MAKRIWRIRGYEEQTEDYQWQIVRGIANGLERYLNEK